MTEKASVVTQKNSVYDGKLSFFGRSKDRKEKTVSKRELPVECQPQKKKRFARLRGNKKKRDSKTDDEDDLLR